MAHFAKLNDNNIVIAVHVVSNDVITIDGIESEQAGIDFLTNLHGYSNWKQTSYNGSFRKRYAGIGDSYDSSKDAFIAPKLYSTWILNESTYQWEPPVPYPQGKENESVPWVWDDNTVSWVDETTITKPEVGITNG
jgi:hypothetical protein